ncbi:MAG: hypothetical protein WBP08_05975 [Saprospiraceae bacterium]
MIKYLILSLISYYIFTYYLSPMIEGRKPRQNDNARKEKPKIDHKDEYVDYEEVE